MSYDDTTGLTSADDLNVATLTPSDDDATMLDSSDDDKMAEVQLGNMKPAPQDLSATCWFTCYDMLFQWKNMDPGTVKKGQIRDKFIAAGIDWDDAVASGLDLKDLRKAADALGLWRAASSDGFAGYDLRDRIRQTSSPLWVAGKWSAKAQDGHVVVVIGASRNQVKFIDPWWQVTKVAETCTWPADVFQQGTRARAGHFALQYWRS